MAASVPLWIISIILFSMPFLLTAEVSINEQKTLNLVPKIDFYPEELKRVVEDEVREVSYGISWEPDNSTSRTSFRDFRISVVSENTAILQVVNSSHVICIRDSEEPTNFTFSVKGIFLGYTKVRVSIGGACDGGVVYGSGAEPLEAELRVAVVRARSILVEAVTAVMAALVALNYINMGVQLDLKIVGKSIKRPIGPSIGFFCQFLFMPLASYALGYLLLEEKSLRLGLFVLGCSPGGSMSNFWTLLFGGDLNLSIAMTFISTIAALAMMPLWIFTLGANLFQDKAATIPYINLAGSLIILTLPMGIGLLIQHKSPRLVKISQKIVEPFTLVCVAVGVGVGLYANRFIFLLFTWQVVLAGMSVAWGGYCCGALVAWIFRLEKPQIIAVSIETAFQNPAVAFVLLLLSLPQPDADLSSVSVIAQLMVTGLPMWALLILFRTYKKIKACYKKEDPHEIPQIETVHKAYLAVDTNLPEEDDDSKMWIEDDWNKVKIVKFKTDQ